MAPTSDSQASTTTTAAHKYGPSAVRDVHYVNGLRQPFVQVKQRKNGQYVVIERLPVHHKPRNHGLPTLQQSLAESEVKLNSLKPDWRPTCKFREADRRDSSPVSLPPINLGWGKKAQARVGSLDNARHEPGGGAKLIPRQKVAWDARAKVGSLDNVRYKSPHRLDTSQSDPLSSHRLASTNTAATTNFQATPRFGAVAHAGSLSSSLHYTPRGGAEVVLAKPRRLQNVRSRVESLENIHHVPGGGYVTVENRRTSWKGESKVGSLDNAKHVPGGGEVSIVNERLSWRSKPRVGSLDNVHHFPGGGSVHLPRNKVEWLGRPRVGSLANVHHRPGGGVISITNNTLKWFAQPKVDTKPPRRQETPDSLDSY